MAMTPVDYCDVFEALERNGVQYVVVSGVAVVLHGHTRPVFDLDIVIAPTPEEQNLALQTLMRAGFVPSIPVPLHMLTVLRMFDQAVREIDVFARYHIPFDELWASSEQRRVGEQLVRLVSLDHLLRAKRTTGREHDLMDVDALLALHTARK
jgi:hypothetical protein